METCTPHADATCRAPECPACPTRPVARLQDPDSCERCWVHEMMGCGSLAFPAARPEGRDTLHLGSVPFPAPLSPKRRTWSRVSSVRPRSNPARRSSLPAPPEGCPDRSAHCTASSRHRRRTDPRGPLHRHGAGASTPGAATSLARDRSRLLRHPAATRDVTFRPRGFSPPRRLAPHRPSRVCCAPLPVMGFDAFHHRRRSAPEGPSRLRRDPRAASTPRRIPLVSSRTASPRPLPSWRYRSNRVPRPDTAPRPKTPPRVPAARPPGRCDPKIPPAVEPRFLSRPRGSGSPKRASTTRPRVSIRPLPPKRRRPSRSPVPASWLRRASPDHRSGGTLEDGSDGLPRANPGRFSTCATLGFRRVPVAGVAASARAAQSSHLQGLAPPTSP